MRVSSSGGWMSAIRPALEARAQPLFEIGDLVRILVGGEDDLPVRLVERVEGVEELLLRAILAGEELDVVHQQHVAALAVAATELVDLPVADAVDVLVHEGLGLEM